MMPREGAERATMPNLNVDELKPGMVLAEDAVHLNGRVLLRAGAGIGEKHIRMLKTWGIYAVSVKGEGENDETAADDEIDPDKYAEADRRMRALFRHADLTHPAMAELFKLRVRNYIKCQGQSDKR